MSKKENENANLIFDNEIAFNNSENLIVSEDDNLFFEHDFFFLSYDRLLSFLIFGYIVSFYLIFLFCLI